MSANDMKFGKRVRLVTARSIKACGIPAIIAAVVAGDQVPNEQLIHRSDITDGTVVSKDSS
jgi:hypothetical protein